MKSIEKSGIILILLIAALFGGAGEYYRCYSYDPLDFRVKPALPYEKVVLAVPKAWPQDTVQPLIFLFLDRTGRKKKLSQYLNCEYNRTMGYYRCGGECDASEVMLEKDISLHFDTAYKLELDIPVQKYAEEERAALDLRAGLSSAKATPTACPLYTEYLFNPLRDGKYNDDPLLHVCYERKRALQNGWHYEGCTMRNHSCREEHLEHFGQYPNQDDAYKAFLRCVDARPRTE